MASVENERMVGDLLAPDIVEMLEARQIGLVRAALSELMDPEIADVLIALPPHQRAMAFRLLPRARAADVFTFLPPEEQEQLLAELTNEQLAQVFDEMDPDDRADLFEEMPGPIVAKLLALMKPEERRQTQIILGYPPESVGRIMTPDYVALRPEWTVQQALDHIRQYGRDAETISTLYIIDATRKLIDNIRLRQLILADPQNPIQSLMTGQVVALRATDDREEAVRAMDRYDQPVLPVVDSGGVLVGIVTFDDVADVAKEEVTEDIQKLGGVEALEAPYLSTPLLELVRKRGLWLSVLFLAQLLTASAMGLFEAEIIQAVVLALFIPLIISSGGNSGSQAATLVIRAMAIHEVALRDVWKVLRRELACGAMLGCWLGLLGLLRILVWHWAGLVDYTDHYHWLGLTVMIALVGVVMWGTLVGSMLPFIIRRLHLDPATVSAPFVATLVDVTGLIIYFTTALLMLSGKLL
ncbi:MAG: magnesium transporter MgtE [Phycisphaerae bacterium]